MPTEKRHKGHEPLDGAEAAMKMLGRNQKY